MNPCLRPDRPVMMDLVFVLFPQAELARYLGVSRSAVSRWTSVPKRHAQAVSAMTDLPVKKLVAARRKRCSTTPHSNPVSLGQFDDALRRMDVLGLSDAAMGRVLRCSRWVARKRMDVLRSEHGPTTEH